MHAHRVDGLGRLAGTRALVTGGASGIGLAVAQRFVEEGGYVTRDCGARVILADSEAGDEPLSVQTGTPLEHVVLFDDDPPRGAVSFQKLLQDAAARFDPSGRCPDDFSTIGYTSGATGHRKGAIMRRELAKLDVWADKPTVG